MDIEIFPHRLLGADTTERLLNDLEDIEGVKRMVVHGPRLPPEEARHPDRRTIKIKGEEVNLQVKTGRVLLEIETEEAIDDVREACEDNLPFGFEVHVGTFIRKQKTVTDNIKYGEDLDKIPDEMVGLTDQSARLSDRATIIKRKKEQ
ncbi:MAG: methyl-coenzyme M reductase operon protein D [Euryarchaeota archaeon]|nr:methyl-coenzyme M reductase operon protein D [Euryarchaeota archaeon]